MPNHDTDDEYIIKDYKNFEYQEYLKEQRKISFDSYVDIVCRAGLSQRQAEAAITALLDDGIVFARMSKCE